MMDKHLFQETFSQLQASEEAKQEVLTMVQENRKQKRRLTGAARAASIAAAVMLALGVTAGAANAATDGALFTILSTVWSDEVKTVYEDADGNTYTAYALHGQVEERDGRLFLVVGEEEIDITDALETEGSYRYEAERDGISVVIEVSGSPEEWTCVNICVADGMTYSSTVSSDDELYAGEIDVPAGSEALLVQPKDGRTTDKG